MSTFAIDTYTGNGSTTSYSVTFPYITTADVIVTINGVTKTLTTHYTFSNSSTISFGSAPANGEVIKITRSSNRNARLVDYQDGSTLTEASLDQDGNQAFFMAQEAIDITTNNISLSNSTDQWDANSKRITNVADPTSAQDVATKNYLENTFLTTANKTALTTVNANIANINAVNSNATNINSAVSNATNINTVATNIGSVNTVATDIAKVITVANDLAEAVSEVETVADDLNETSSEIDTVAGAITNVNNVGNNIANVNTVAGISANVTTVAGNNSNVSTVAGISGNVTTVAGISSDVTTVAGIASDVSTVRAMNTAVVNVSNIAPAVSGVNSNSSNINAVNANSTNINTVAGNNSNINTVAGVSSDVTTVAGISSDVQAVENIASNVTTVAGIASAVTAVNSNATNVNAVGGSITNVNNVGGSIANVNTVAGNLSGVNAFGERYRVSSNAPTSSLDVGDLWFDSTNNILKVYGASGFQSAGSSVNGLLDTFKYTVSSSTTTISGADDNSNTLAYDANKVSVFLNGIRMVTGTDITATNGTSIVFASAIGATGTDIVEIEAFGTFSVANMNASNLTSGTVPDARITGAYTGITNLTMSGDLTVDTNTLFVDASENKVGVGTTTPLENLTVESSSFPIVAISNNSASNPTNGVALDLIERSTSGAVFGQNGVFGFRQFLDAQTNRFDIISGNQTTTNTRLSIERDTGNIGIGTTSPLATLHVDSGNSGVTPNANADNLFIENNGAAGITIGSSTNEKGNIFFADSGNALDGYIQYAHDSRYLRFATATSERMRIDSSGNLLVGTTTDYAVSSSTVTGSKIRNDGIASFFRDNATPLYVGRQNGDGTLIDFRRSGTTVGIISTDNSSNLTIKGKSSSDFSILFGTNKLNPKNYAGTGAKDNAVDLGDNDDRWKDLYLGGGLYVGGTGTANKLDDYEEGNWTATVNTATNFSTGITSGTSTYTKIGNTVWIKTNFNLGNSSGTVTAGDNVTITNLPFAPIAQDNAINNQYRYNENNAILTTTTGSSTNSIFIRVNYVRGSPPRSGGNFCINFNYTTNA